jgi:hypothetical protein
MRPSSMSGRMVAGHADHLFGPLGCHLSEKGFRQLPEAAGET